MKEGTGVVINIDKSDTLLRSEKEFIGKQEIPLVFGSHGIKLHGKVILPAFASVAHPVPGAVLCHGFGADHRVMETSASILADKGIATIIFDLRGHGLSEGYLDDNFYEDIADAWQTLTCFPEVDSTRVALIGHSLGAISSILAARNIKMKPKALVALSCPYEVRGLVFEDPSHPAFGWTRKAIELIWKMLVWYSGLKVKVNWNKFLDAWPQMRLSTALAELDDCDKLFVFCAGDTLTPYKRFAHIYEKARGPKQKLVTRGTHITPVQAEILRFEWVGWVVSALRA